MDRHIARMQRASMSHSKSQSEHGQLISPEEAIATREKVKTKKKKKKSVKKPPEHRSSVPNLMNPQYKQKVIQSQKYNDTNSLVNYIKIYLFFYYFIFFNLFCEWIVMRKWLEIFCV